MGDRTTVRITIAAQDRDKWIEGMRHKREIDRDEVPDDPESNTATFEYDEWNYPAAEDFHVPGVPFVGWHGCGGEYPAQYLAGDGESFDERAVYEGGFGDSEGFGIKANDEGLPDAADLACLRDFISLRDRAEALINRGGH